MPRATRPSSGCCSRIRGALGSCEDGDVRDLGPVASTPAAISFNALCLCLHGRIFLLAAWFCLRGLRRALAAGSRRVPYHINNHWTVCPSA